MINRIAIYGAIIATASLSWQIYNHVFRDKGKLLISHNLEYNTDVADTINIHFSNTGIKPITITEYMLNDGKDGLTSFAEWPETLFPKTLHPSEIISLSLDVRPATDDQWNEIREILAYDSPGKRWTKKFTKAEITEIKNTYTESCERFSEEYKHQKLFTEKLNRIRESKAA